MISGLHRLGIYYLASVKRNAIREKIDTIITASYIEILIALKKLMKISLFKLSLPFLRGIVLILIIILNTHTYKKVKNVLIFIF